MRRGAIILCGGESSRLGRDKATLPFGPDETMLQRVVRLVSEVVPAERIVCVAAPGQELPELPAAVQIVVDPTPHEGPLAGLANGVAAVQHKADAAFVTGCDAPLLLPAFINRMFELLADYEIAAPHDGERWHPLAGVYRAELLPRAEALLARGRRSLISLLEASRTRRVTSTDVRDIDPHLASLATCNTPAEYHDALQRTGLAATSSTPMT